MQLLMKGIQDDLKHFAKITEEKNLQTNYRSKKEIIAFNNLFFSVAPSFLKVQGLTEKEESDLSKAYSESDVEQTSTGKNDTGGFVEIALYNSEQQPESEEEGLTRRDVALKFLLTTINKVIKHGYEQKDIAVLVRRNSEGSLVSEYLFENGFSKIISSESLLLNKSPKIIFLIQLMRLLNNPTDKIAAAGCIHYYLDSVLKKETAKHDVFKMVNDTKLIYETLPAAFSNHRQLLKKLPLYELTEQLTQIFGQNNQPDSYIQRFEDSVLEYLQKNPPVLSSFLQWWDESRDDLSVIVPADENAIRVLSIHKAKGLQFPVVIIPFPDWQLKPKPNSVLWVSSSKKPYDRYSLLPVNLTSRLDKTYFKKTFTDELNHTLIDNLNLLYVAFTRPENRLYVFCPVKKSENVNYASQLITSVLEATEELKKKIIDVPQLKLQLFRSGEEKQKDKKNAEAEKSNSMEHPEVISLEKYLSNPWQHKLVLAVNKNKISADDKEKAKTNFGIAVHNLFSKIILEADSEKAIAECLKSGLVQPEKENEIRKMIDAVFKLCKEHKWFTSEWEIKTEAEMLLPDGTVIRPDRVMIKNKKIVLLDYKTGEEDEAHQKQMKDYSETIIKAGYEKAESYLLYLKQMKLVKIVNLKPKI